MTMSAKAPLIIVIRATSVTSPFATVRPMSIRSSFVILDGMVWSGGAEEQQARRHQAGRAGLVPPAGPARDEHGRDRRRRAGDQADAVPVLRQQERAVRGRAGWPRRRAGL